MVSSKYISSTPQQYYGFLGVGKSETKKREEIYNLIRNEFPAPADCASTNAKLAKLKKDLSDAEGKYKAEPGSNSLPRYIEAYNKIILEYINYLNNNCVQPAVVMPSAIAENGSDPVLNSATQSGSKTEANNNSQIKFNQQASPITDKARQIIKSIPKWALYSGAGLLGVIIVISVVKK